MAHRDTAGSKSWAKKERPASPSQNPSPFKKSVFQIASSTNSFHYKESYSNSSRYCCTSPEKTGMSCTSPTDTKRDTNGHHEMCRLCSIHSFVYHRPGYFFRDKLFFTNVSPEVPVVVLRYNHPCSFHAFLCLVPCTVLCPLPTHRSLRKTMEVY